MILIMDDKLAQGILADEEESLLELRDLIRAEQETSFTGTRVICDDRQGPPDVKVIKDDYVLVAEGSCELTYIQHYRNGTAQLTLKGRK